MIGRRRCTHLPHQLAIPAFLRRPRGPRLRRVEIGENLIDHSIDRSFFETKQALHSVAAVVCEVGDISVGWSARQIVSYEARIGASDGQRATRTNLACRLVVVQEVSRCIALSVQRIGR